jgi:hypothetical protein
LGHFLLACPAQCLYKPDRALRLRNRKVAVLDDIGREKQRLTERLAQLDVQREKLATQLTELEAAERVLSRFAQPEQGGRRRPGRRARTTATTETAASRQALGRTRTVATRGSSISDMALQVVQAHPEGISATDILKQLSGKGHTVRPNHLGVALQRYRRAGRLEHRDQRWYPPARSGTAG